MGDWKKFGLKSEPNVGDNGVRASASPFDGLAQHIQVKIDPSGKKKPLFDQFEDMDAPACLDKCKVLQSM